jgi:hypothetical protein
VTAKGREEGCSQWKWLLDILDDFKPGWAIEGLSNKYLTSSGHGGWKLFDGEMFVGEFSLHIKPSWGEFTGS